MWCAQTPARRRGVQPARHACPLPHKDCPAVPPVCACRATSACCACTRAGCLRGLCTRRRQAGGAPLCPWPCRCGHAFASRVQLPAGLAPPARLPPLASSCLVDAHVFPRTVHPLPFSPSPSPSLPLPLSPFPRPAIPPPPPPLRCSMACGTAPGCAPSPGSPSTPSPSSPLPWASTTCTRSCRASR